MTIKKINNNNVVFNKVLLNPKKEFVFSAETDPDGFTHSNKDKLNKLSGVQYDDFKLKNYSSKSIKYIDTIPDGIANIGKHYLEYNSTVQTDINSVRIYKDEDNDIRFSKNLNDDLNFNIKRLSRKYLARDLETEKFNSVRRLYSYYNTNTYHDKYKDLKWGFSNYNCLNLYTIGKLRKNVSDDLNTSIESGLNKTHSNIIVYPNPLNESGVQNYNVSINTNSKSKTFSFYINVNKKNIKPGSTKYEVNAGCVLFVPGIISIHVIKGSSTDESGLTDSYRILTQLGQDSLKKIDYEKIYTNTSTQVFAVSEDNFLKFNNWHNVVISISNINTDKYLINYYLDGEFKESFNKVVTFSDYSEKNSFITIGNKFFLKQDEIDNSINKVFLDSFSIDTIYNHEYVNLGKDITLKSGTEGNGYYKLYNSLFTNSVIANNESFALNAEIHDIRIYDSSCDKLMALDIAKKGVNEDTINLDRLIFYVPFYYIPNLVAKKNVVNLHKTGTDNKLTLKNSVNNFPTNIYSFNYCNLHINNLENYLCEFINNASPRIIYSNNRDYTRNFEGLSRVLYTQTDLRSSSQLGEDPYYKSIKLLNNTGTINQSIYFENVVGNESAIANDSYSLDFIYNKNLILPNDNGLQRQHFDFVISKYYEDLKESYIFKASSDYNYYDLSKVNLENYYDSTELNELLQKDEDFTSSDSIKIEIDPNQTLRLYNYIGETKNFTLTELSTQLSSSNLTLLSKVFLEEDRFLIRKDKLWNISNRNFFSPFYKDDTDNNTYFGSEGDDFMVCRFTNAGLSNTNIQLKNTINNITYSNTDNNEALNNKDIINLTKDVYSINENNKYKSYSNPCSRLYDSVLDVNSFSNLNNELYVKNNIRYYNAEMPLYSTDHNLTEQHSCIFEIPNYLLNSKIDRNTFEIEDVDVFGSGGNLNIKLKDNNYGGLFRSNCLTKKAEWNYVGHLLYNEGFATILHPGLSNFGFSNFRVKYNTIANLFVHELNLSANSGEFNNSSNSSYINNLRMNNSSFNFDENFVYITDINLHDENLNIIAKARLSQPFAKKDSDNVTFRLKMDY